MVVVKQHQTVKHAHILQCRRARSLPGFYCQNICSQDTEQPFWIFVGFQENPMNPNEFSTNPTAQLDHLVRASALRATCKTQF